MKGKRFTDEQIIAVLKEAEAGGKTKELCRRHGISEATFYNWKAKYAGMTVSEARRQKEAIHHDGASATDDRNLEDRIQHRTTAQLAR